jgi:hypothetical protein
MEKVKALRDAIVKQSSDRVTGWLKNMQYLTAYEGHAHACGGLPDSPEALKALIGELSGRLERTGAESTNPGFLGCARRRECPRAHPLGQGQAASFERSVARPASAQSCFPSAYFLTFV